MRVHLTIYPVVDEQMLAKEHDLVSFDDPSQVDAVVYFSTEQHEGVFPRERAIMVQVEPPLAAYRQLVYARKVADHFHSVFTFNPDPAADNQYLLTPAPHVFPYRPREARRRKNTTMNGRKWYYAGDRYQQWSAPDAFGSVNLYPARSILAQQLIKECPDLPHYVTGKGWDEDTREAEDWRTVKLDEIDIVQADFVLCMENSRFPNYISEKIHDGFNSDRVVFYLGAPNVQEFIPEDCFINLNEEPYWVPSHKAVDWTLVAKRMREMTQTEYDEILGKAREFKDSVLTMDAYREERTAFTYRVMEQLRTLQI